MTTDRGVSLTILLCSSASLAYEVALTRIFSISLWYHFAFMIISIAMLGFAASGTALSLYPRLREIGNLALYALLLGLAIPASYLLANRVPFDPVRLGWETTQFLYIGLYYLILAAPFFCAGLVIATAFTVQSSQAGLFYGADLLGAGLGSLGVLALLGVTAPEQGVFIISTAPLAAAWLAGGERIRSAALLLIALCLYFFFIPSGFTALRISPYKGLPTALLYPGAAPLKTYQTPFARIDTFTSPAVRFAPGLSLRYLDPLPRQIGVAVDGGEITAITAADDRKALAFLDYLPSALPYELGKKGRVLVLDPKGGLQALAAQRFGANQLVKVESNSSLVHVIRRDWAAFSGNIYDDRTFTGLGRSWLRGSGEKFDIIDISLQGTEPFGSFGIAEDYRFTVEAFKEYLGHLDKDGMLGLNLYIIPPPRSELRLLATLVRALEELGAEEPARHLAAVRSWGSISLVVKRSPLTAADIETVRRFAAERRFDLLLYPGITAAETGVYVKTRGSDYFRAFAALLDPGQRGKFMADYMFDVAPVVDDRPFFNYFLKLGRTGDIYRAMGGKWQFFLEEGYIVPAVCIQVLVLGLALFLVPAFALKGKTDMTRARPLVSPLLRLPRTRIHVRGNRADPEDHSPPRTPLLCSGDGARLPPHQLRGGEPCEPSFQTSAQPRCCGRHRPPYHHLQPCHSGRFRRHSRQGASGQGNPRLPGARSPGASHGDTLSHRAPAPRRPRPPPDPLGMGDKRLTVGPCAGSGHHARHGVRIQRRPVPWSVRLFTGVSYLEHR